MKRVLSAILALFLVLSLSAAVFANNPRVVDKVHLLSSVEVSNLEKKAQALVDTYGIDVVIVTVNSLEGRSSQAYADDYFDHNGYGVGSDDSGVLLLLAMKEREWYVSTHADGIAAVSDSDISGISDRILEDLSSGDYYDAFSSYLDLLEDEFYSYRNAPEEAFGFKDIVLRLIIALLIGAAIAGIALLVMRSKMNTARSQSGARSYMISGSYDLYRRQDIFLYSHTTKTRKAENNSGGGTHRSSSGRSHGGRGGRF